MANHVNKAREPVPIQIVRLPRPCRPYKARNSIVFARRRKMRLRDSPSPEPHPASSFPSPQNPKGCRNRQMPKGRNQTHVFHSRQRNLQSD